MLTKSCKSCKQIISLEFFCKNKNTKDQLSTQCKSCAKKYRDVNKENRKKCKSLSSEYRKEYLELNKDRINKLRRERYSNSTLDYKQNQSEKKREYYLNNKELLISKMSTYYLKTKIISNNRSKLFRKNNKESIYLRNRARRGNLSSLSIDQDLLNKLIKSYDDCCAYCGIFVEAGNNLHLDHVVSLFHGGSHTIDNLVPSCATCNLRKGTKSKNEFLHILKQKSEIGEN